jgi:hypothetical protein
MSVLCTGFIWGRKNERESAKRKYTTKKFETRTYEEVCKKKGGLSQLAKRGGREKSLQLKKFA